MPYIPKVLCVKDVIPFGDYEFFNAHATVLKVSNIKKNILVPAVSIDAKSLAEFEDYVGFKHTPETWIRSYMMLYAELFNNKDVTIIRNVDNPVDYCRAVAQHFSDKAHDYSYEYDVINKHGFTEVPGKYYTFDMPDEFYCVIPMELGSWFEAVNNDEACMRILGQLAYGYLNATIPISNIRIVED